MAMTNGKAQRSAVIFSTPWGWMGVSETEKGLDRIVLPKRSKQAVSAELHVDLAEATGSDRLETAKRQVLDYLKGRRDRFDLPLDLSGGTGFQRQVWRTLQRVPYGKLRSYQWVAARVGGPRYARAVGNAVGANPLPIVIPCHRIVAQDASLGGFSGGLPTKRKLLTLEGTLRYLK
ncbi:methylated-DNA--[protein]-cysteine S-methyltransferase [Nitrospira moscoviensis]|uniref:Methylated-DNA--protein-cysteine methyltransferase n=1 Tax=Nitrospira moscoviensis TaxID=42253 RepID=A0A0K2GK77_NITMO|nr:methylated-DNA--[protein]-cysteine S-methyltransferase [Nitrospira moscoviensis]ALA61007.1 Methylated-DNA-[protein]-cysteine S-methyltransferase [Nitrospira moscoviensis]